MVEARKNKSMVWLHSLPSEQQSNTIEMTANKRKEDKLHTKSAVNEESTAGCNGFKYERKYQKEGKNTVEHTWGD